MSEAEESLGEWLDRRLVAVDADLAERIRGAVPENSWRIPLPNGAESLAGIATAHLRVLLANGCDTRAAAPELLVIDALVTYACEALADAPGDVSDRAEFMMRELTNALPPDVTA